MKAPLSTNSILIGLGIGVVAYYLYEQHKKVSSPNTTAATDTASGIFGTLSQGTSFLDGLVGKVKGWGLGGNTHAGGNTGTGGATAPSTSVDASGNNNDIGTMEDTNDPTSPSSDDGLGDMSE